MAKAARSQRRLTNAEAYLELAREAANMVDAYRIRAERFSKSGEEQIAAEYRRLAHEAAARSERYGALAALAGTSS